MIKARKKTIALITVLVFMLTIVAPMAAFAADKVTYGSSYDFVEADDAVAAGTITVTVNQTDAALANGDFVYVELTLPEGVEFIDDIDFDDLTAPADSDVDTSSDDSVRVKATSDGSSDITLEFNFDGLVDVDSDFTGNLDVTVEVVGVDHTNSKMLWSESKKLTIAKVTAADATVKADTAKNISPGGGRDCAKITVTEPYAGALAGEQVRFDIATSGVKFANTGNFGGLSVTAQDLENDSKRVVCTPDSSTTFPGKIEFTPSLNIAPNVTGEIKITVTSADKTVKKTTVVVAKIGDAKVEVDKLKDNDTVAYVGQETGLDVELTLKTTDEFKRGDILDFKLNQGKFVSVDADKGTKGFYSKDKAFYVTFNTDTDKVKLENLKIKLNNDAEPGDLTLTVGGDYGTLDEIVIGEVAKPISVTAETPNILSEALNQKGGDIVVTEVDDGALSVGQVVYFELPSGIELKGTPKVEVDEGNIEVEDPVVIDKNIIALEIKSDSSDAGTIRIYNINYNTGRLALYGPVELEVYLAGADGVMATVANAKVDDQNTVTASFALGDEGVTIANGRTLVQVNLLCDVLGLQKSWDAAAKTAYFAKDGKVVAFPMGENAIYINGVKLPVDQGGKIINDFTYATLRGVQLAFGGDLDWDNDTKTATFVFNK